MKRNIVIALAILFTGCATSKVALTAVEDANYKYGKGKFTSYTKKQFLEGKLVNEKNCGSCHKLKDPARFTEQQLNKIIPNMAKKAKITDAEKDVVLKYYVASGKRS